jgi:hypothetical protein
MEDEMQQQFTVKTPQGETHKVQGDPFTLTLRDLISEVGKTGGERFQEGGVRFRVSGKEYRSPDTERPLGELGIQPNATIEIVS